MGARLKKLRGWSTRVGRFLVAPVAPHQHPLPTWLGARARDHLRKRGLRKNTLEATLRQPLVEKIWQAGVTILSASLSLVCHARAGRACPKKSRIRDFELGAQVVKLVPVPLGIPA